MARAYKCDICGSLFDVHTEFRLRYDKYALLSNSNLYYDICPDCKNAIQEVINQRMKYKN